MKSLGRIVLFLQLLVVNQTYGQDNSNFVTAIDVTTLLSNTVLIQWRSDVPKGEFSIYYTTKGPIQNLQDLRNSEIAITTNLSGIALDSLFVYEQQLQIQDSGDYYFAIVFKNSQLTDRIAKDLAPPIPLNISLIPNLNTTAQPLALLQNIPLPPVEERFQEYFERYGSVITSLLLESDKDVFRLRWSVYPKTLDQYVFSIYRSRYPITRYSSPQGLPVYATVTNQFYFEDRSISFEIPYYYAVVPQDSIQWQRGINIIDKPAILLREAPPFTIEPTVEYVKVKAKSPIKVSDVLSETDIQIAVQQTLENLQLLPIPVSNQPAPQVVQPATLEEVSNLQLLGSEFIGPTEPKLNDSDKTNTFAEQTLEDVIKIRNQSIRLQERAEEAFVKKELETDKIIAKKLDVLKYEIKKYRSFEDRFVTAYDFSDKDLKEQLDLYYQQRSKVRVGQYAIRSDIIKRKDREQEFIDHINSLQRQEKLKQSELINDRVAGIGDQLKRLRVTYLEKADRQHKLQKETAKINYINNISSSLSTRVLNINPNMIGSEQRQYGVVSPELEKNNQLAKLQESPDIPKDQEPLIQQEQQRFVQQNDFSWTNNVADYLPAERSAQERLIRAQRYYQEVAVEKIPDVNEITTETWLSQKYVWQQENNQLWHQQNQKWRQRIFEILGAERYNRIQNKWMKPSSSLAAVEAVKAFRDKRYDEAMYLYSFVANDQKSVMLLGQTFYHLGAYKDAFSVFITALQMGVPNAREWVDVTAEQLLGREILENE